MQTVEERTPVIVAHLLEPFSSTCRPLRGAWGADRPRAGTGRGWRLGRRRCGRGLSLAPGVTCLDPRATISNACWVAATHPTGMASGQGEGRFKRSAPLGHSLVLGEDPECPPLLHRFSSPPIPPPRRPQATVRLVSVLGLASRSRHRGRTFRDSGEGATGVHESCTRLV